jgi:hypothetical protein
MYKTKRTRIAVTTNKPTLIMPTAYSPGVSVAR